MAIPSVVSRSGEVIGGLFFGHSQRAMFSERSEELIGAFAVQAAIAIDNARLYDMAQRAAEEREHLLASERAARAEAERHNKMKDEFLAMLAHELRNPLAPITSAAQLLRLPEVNEGLRLKASNIISRQVRHMTELVDDLLPVDAQADILLINPPFARSIGRPVDRHAAARHLQASLRRLKSGGRAVAIMPTWFDSQMLGSEATIRLDAVLPRGLYVKHGTGIAVRLLVLDKLPAPDKGPVEQEMTGVSALLDAVQRLPARAHPSDPTPPTPRPEMSQPTRMPSRGYRAPSTVRPVSPPVPSRMAPSHPMTRPAPEPRTPNRASSRATRGGDSHAGSRTTSSGGGHAHSRAR